MTTLPAEWRVVPTHVRWPDPDLERRYDAGEVVLDDGNGAEVIRSDTVADDLIGDLEGGPCRNSSQEIDVGVVLNTGRGPCGK